MKRRRLVPEVVQSSAMDCGPACLKAVLEGFGIAASYGALRDACQTDVDGTSIDAIEELATRLGLAAEQIMVPIDHLLLKESNLLPAIVVVRTPDGFTHFVVVWSVVGTLVQVMDPAAGRRWMTRERFLADVFEHSQAVPASAWEEWARSDEFRRALAQRARRVDPSHSIERRLATRDTSENGWKSMATLDAAVRLVDRLVEGGVIAAGPAAGRAIDSLCREDFSAALEDWSSARTAPEDEEGAPQLIIRGAVLVRLQPPPQEAAPSPELDAVRSNREERPLREVARMLASDGWARPAVTLSAIALVSAATLVEALVFRALVDAGHDLALPQQRWGAFATLASLLLFLLVIEFAIGRAILGVGRRLEVRYRATLLAKIPTLGDRYFTTRPLSDLAERSHAMHQLRDLGETAWTFCRASFELLFVSAALALLFPAGWLLVIGLATVSAAIPLLAVTPLREYDLRARTHLGALSRFYLDALLGLVPARAHGAHAALRREHESLLVEWVRANRARIRVLATAQGVQLSAGLALGAWLVVRYLDQAAAPGGVLLVAFWVFRIPALGDEIAVAVRRYPAQRSIVLRLAEPLSAADDETPDDTASQTKDIGPLRPALGGESYRREVPGTPLPPTTRAWAVDFSQVRVVAGGNTILRDITLSVSPGSHLAIVGASGAGKSTLLSLLLGWRKADDGFIDVDGIRLDALHLASVRRGTAWLDPSVQLWNRTLLENVVYGAEPSAVARVPEVVDEAGLRPLLRGLPKGMATELGESGALVSGGEGQRVRLARALLRTEVSLVVLDEPFRGLDADGRQQALQNVRERFRSATLFLATHNVRAALDLDRVLVMHDGTIVEDGSPRELAGRADSHFRRMLDADDALSARVWRRGDWRRLRLVDGGVVDVTVAVPE
jgi:ATP-binding cassette subfamily B protein